MCRHLLFAPSVWIHVHPFLPCPSQKVLAFQGTYCVGLSLTWLQNLLPLPALLEMLTVSAISPGFLL